MKYLKRLAVAVTALAIACGPSESKQPETPDNPAGTCIPVEVYPGYETCVMSKPQILPAESVQQNLDDLPESVNLRTKFIDEYCPPVSSQGKCGWCTPHAVTSAMEALYCKNKETENISEPHLWINGGQDIDQCQGGWFISDAMETATESKLVPSSVWSYSDIAGRMSSTKPSRDLLSKGTYIFDDYARVDGVDGIRSALASDSTVVFNFPVFCDSGWYYKSSNGTFDSNVGSIIAPSTDIGSCGEFTGCENSTPDCRIGYHAVLLVGYDDNAQEFILRNSWDVGWADGGYSRISYDYVERFGQGGATPTLCIPLEEICDGKDNNCNGLVDEFGCDVPVSGGTDCSAPGVLFCDDFNGDSLDMGKWEMNSSNDIWNVSGGILQIVTDNSAILNSVSNHARSLNSLVYEVKWKAEAGATDFLSRLTNAESAIGFSLDGDSNKMIIGVGIEGACNVTSEIEANVKQFNSMKFIATENGIDYFLNDELIASITDCIPNPISMNVLVGCQSSEGIQKNCEVDFIRLLEE
jgi:hypothetical protein